MVEFKTKQLRLVKATDNPYHQELEQYFGEDLPKPRKLVLDSFNRLALLAQALRFRDPFLITAAFTNSSGIFMPEYGSYVRTKGDDVLGDHHEEVHAMVYTKNPDVSRSIVDLVESYERRVEFNCEFNCERAVVFTTLDEGVADFVSIDLGLNSKDDRRQHAALEAQEIFLYAKDKSGRYQTHLIDQAYEIIGACVDTLYAAFKDSSYRSSRDFLLAVYGQGRVPFFPGYQFVQRAVGLLKYYQGVSNPEAIKQLIQEPPTSLSELQNPESYTDRIGWS